MANRYSVTSGLASAVGTGGGGATVPGTGDISWTRSTRRSDTAALSVARPPAGWPFEEQDEEKVVVELMRIAYTEYFT